MEEKQISNTDEELDQNVEGQEGQGKSDEESKDDESKEPSKDNINYGERLEKEKGKPDLTKAQIAFNERKQKREQGEEVNDEKPLTLSELDKVLEERENRLKKEVLADRISSIAKSISKSGTPEETDLIVEIHKNRIWPSTMSLEQQLQEAKAIANMPHVEAQNQELKKVIKSNDSKSGSNISSHRDSLPKEKKEGELVIISETEKRKILYDPKTHKRIIVQT